MRLKNKVAIITGASSGIGLATAKRFVLEGAHVFITGRREAELDQAKEAIGEGVTTVQGDLANLDDLDRLFTIVKQDKGGLDIIVANAGFLEVRTLEQVTPEHFDQTFAVNVRGTLFLVQKSLPLLRNGASIVLISSAAHRIGVADYTTYSASKAAVRSFARTWAAELKVRGIRVNAISPGSIDTPSIDGMSPTKEIAEATRAQMATDSPLGRIGHPDEIANAALFLASDEASYTTGADLTVDGGQTQL